MVFSEAEGRDLHLKSSGGIRSSSHPQMTRQMMLGTSDGPEGTKGPLQLFLTWPKALPQCLQTVIYVFKVNLLSSLLLCHFLCKHQSSCRLRAKASLMDVASSSHPWAASWRLRCGSPAMLFLFCLEQSRHLPCFCVVMAKHWNSLFLINFLFFSPWFFSWSLSLLSERMMSIVLQLSRL